MRPSRVSAGQRLLWRLEVLGFDLVRGLMRLLPVETASSFGAGLFATLGPRTPLQRLVERNLELAFPEKDAAERDRIALESWRRLGRMAAEFTMLDRLTPASGRVEVVGRERLEAIARDNIPAVLISGHFSNFEIMAAVIVDSGVRCQVTYRAANNPYFDARIVRARQSYGVKLFAPKGVDGSRELLRAMNRGESVSFLNDQKFGDGIAAPFFGHIAYTAAGPTRMALQRDGRLVPMSVQRTKGARFRVVIHEPIVLTRSGDRKADLAAGVAQVNAFVEERVRERPEEWWWVHKRWPNECYPKKR
ncbi:MAG TPA: lysophospholipid acyltransferase family protein [Caulobacteraceae bacterium]|jgi:KDO2-lipid IV(A) lauroyltransferase|nr:lysophospholipid acyltransferase family protein [Caulobacteraceae bacterium]